MSFKSWKSVVSKVLTFSIVVGACVGGTAIQASAASADDGPVSAQGGPLIVGGTLHVWGEEVALGPGKVVKKVNADAFNLAEDANHNPTGLRLENGGFHDRPSGTATYQINELGQPTPFWIQVELSMLSSWEASATCQVFEGEPDGTPGDDTHKQHLPFDCWTVQHGSDWDYSIMVEPTELAKSSGMVTPEDGLSLDEGSYRTDVPYHRDGHTAVSAGQSTKFFTVLSERDEPFYDKQARTEFAYQIVDGGKDTGLWAAGVSTNFRGWDKFSADGRCAIYDSNPLGGGGRLDDHSPVEGSGYSCTANGEFVHDAGEDDNRHFNATFQVGRK